MIKTKGIFIFTSILFTITLSCNTKKSVSKFKVGELELAKLYNQITDYGLTRNYDSVLHYSVPFETKLKSLVLNNPESFDYPFDSLKNIGIKVITSKDKKLRIFSWDNWTGGTKHNFSQIIQIRINEKVYSEYLEGGGEDKDPGVFCSEIYNKNIEGKEVYFIIENGIYSTKETRQSIKSVEISETGKLLSASKFKTRNDTFAVINVDFDFFSVVDRPERPLELIKFEDKSHKILIPVVNEIGVVSDSFLVYKFNGKEYKYIGMSKN